MASTIIIKNGAGGSTPSSLKQGELAINVTNGSNMLCWTCEHSDIGDNNEIVVVCNTDNGGAYLDAEL